MKEAKTMGSVIIQTRHQYINSCHPDHFRRKELEATRIRKLWYGGGSATKKERIYSLLKAGYSIEEITQGLNLPPSRASQVKTNPRANTNTVEAHAIWEDIKSVYDYRCAYCGKKALSLTKDHVVSIRSGGADRMDNIVPACKSCNSSKHTKALLEWDKFYSLQLHLLGDII